MNEVNNIDPPKEEVKEEKQERIEPTNIEKYNEARKKEAESSKIKEEKKQEKQLKSYLKEAIEARKAHAPLYVLNLIDKLDPESQLEVLKAHDKRRADPNVSSIGTPIGREKGPLEQYMTFNPTKDRIDYDIPASVLMNRDKNKKLLGRE